MILKFSDTFPISSIIEEDNSNSLRYLKNDFDFSRKYIASIFLKKSIFSFFSVLKISLVRKPLPGPNSTKETNLFFFILL